MLKQIKSKFLSLKHLPERLINVEKQVGLFRNSATSQEIQTLLKLQYKKHLSGDKHRPYLSFEDVGFRVYSQFEEDGILLYIFSLIGTANKKVVEICAENGRECMSTNLIINHGWQGFLFDGSADNVQAGKQFFSSHKDTFIMPPTFKEAWFTSENVNSILENAEVSGEIDLLSLDIDGMDYWIWKAIDCIRPRVCIFETHNVIPSDLSLTVGYDPNFCYLNQPIEKRDFRSASLLAMTKLSKLKGYRLIGSHKHGFNCFFMRDDIGQDLFPEVDVKSCHQNPYTVSAQTYRWPKVQNLDWQEV